MPLSQSGKRLLSEQDKLRRDKAEMLITSLFCLTLSLLILWSMFRP